MGVMVFHYYFLKITFFKQLTAHLLRLFAEIMLSLQLEIPTLNIDMLRKFAMAFITAATLSGLMGCNSDSSWDNHLVLQTSVAVTGFSLQEDDDVLSNLDSVYFSIDLDKAIIYNADSLPLGTKTDRLVVNISTDGTSVCELKFVNKNGVDTVVNYLTNSTDSINFSNGPVTLHLVSVDQSNSRDYQIFVNVHKMKADSLSWGRAARKNLPSMFGVPAMQKTVRQGEILYCLTGSGTDYCIAYTDHPEKGWSMEQVTFSFDPDINSFAATDNSLFILSGDGSLYKSEDKGKNWSSTGQKWFNVIGGYKEHLLGVTERSGVFYHASYPQIGDEKEVDGNFPVDGTSQLYVYDNKWASNPQAIMLGGRNAAGDVINNTWAFDGSGWADLTQKAPEKAACWTLVPYYECITDSTSWRSKKADVLVAIGGICQDGTLQKDVYLSKDLGFNWRKASQNMQLPEYVGARYSAQAFVYISSKTSEENTESSLCGNGSWEIFEAPSLPRWWKIASQETLDRYGIRTRAVKPYTKWDTPYIYMFGGYNVNGMLYNTVWRGVVNRLEFKPLQ